jgi:dTDP-4-dehydrorhamnose reductase
MRIAVTGANGTLGGAAVAALLGRHDLLALGRGRCRLAAGPFTWVEADLGDGRSVEAALLEFRAEAILHAGGVTDVDGCERHPDEARRVNVGGTEQVARAAKALGARLIAVSTDYVFDGAAGPYREEDLPGPLSVYGRTKLDAERAALAIAPGALVARTAVLFSGLPGAKRTFPIHVVEALSRGERVKAFQDQRVSPTWAPNAAEMMVELVLAHRNAGILHVAGATVIDRVDLAHRVARAFGLDESLIDPVLTADAKLAAPRPLKAGLDVGRAQALLSVKPLELDAAIARFRAGRA